MSSRILIIDANKGGKGPPDPYQDNAPSSLVCNPKWRAVSLVAQVCKADMIWQSPETPGHVRGGYEVLVFNRSLPGIRANLAWLHANPTAQVFHITNDYLVIGGPLYMAAKMLGRPVQVIANYPRSFKRVPDGLVASWSQVNLNALLYEPLRAWGDPGVGCVYYGAFRPERIGLARKYCRGDVTILAPPETCREWETQGVNGPFVEQRVPWHTTGLRPWRAALYMENEGVHSPYFYNRFYEALSWGLPTIFPVECWGTVQQAGYRVPRALVIDAPEQIPEVCRGDYMDLLHEWRDQATAEQRQVLTELATMIRGEG